MTQSATRDFATEFKLSITKALADQLADKLEALAPAPLTEEVIGRIQPRSGVYLLYHNNHRVYVGKAQQSLSGRLHNHWSKLRGRSNISIKDMSFVCLYVDEDLDAAAPERLLIKRYRNEGDRKGAIWNTNGFGNKDPGRNRDMSEVEKNHFDAMHPVNLGFNDLRFGLGRTTVGSFLLEAKRQLPYNLRFDKNSPEARRDYDAELEVSHEQFTTEEVICLVVGTLPEGWQATALPGYLILYPKQENYPSALRWWRRRGDQVDATAHTPTLAPAADIREFTGSSD